MKNTKIMRVPTRFKLEVFRIANKRGYKATEFLDKFGVNILRNSDALGDVVDVLWGKKKKLL